jgi:hypothetical protein
MPRFFKRKQTYSGSRLLPVERKAAGKIDAMLSELAEIAKATERADKAAKKARKAAK